MGLFTSLRVNCREMSCFEMSRVSFPSSGGGGMPARCAKYRSTGDPGRPGEELVCV